MNLIKTLFNICLYSIWSFSLFIVLQSKYGHIFIILCTQILFLFGCVLLFIFKVLNDIKNRNYYWTEYVCRNIKMNLHHKNQFLQSKAESPSFCDVPFWFLQMSCNSLYPQRTIVFGWKLCIQACLISN